MKVQQRAWQQGAWSTAEDWLLGSAAQLVLVFGDRQQLKEVHPLDEIIQAHPNAAVVGCSTGGEILGAEQMDNSIVVTAIAFDSTRVRTSVVQSHGGEKSFDAGKQLTAELAGEDLQHMLVLSEGVHTNGNDLVKGLLTGLPRHVTLTGGLAGDATQFVQTVVIANGKASQDQVVGVGLYGKHLRIGCGSQCGWDFFGQERRVTRARGNVLYELDGEPVLAIYKQYLGRHADELPLSGLQFPLSLMSDGASEAIVRTIVGISEKDQSLTFAADISEGMIVRMMRAKLDHLLDGAADAGVATQSTLGDLQSELAILVSCIGRKLILKQRAEEELEKVASALTGQPAMTGFYSYGEIAPPLAGKRCEFHNQTMTVTAITEIAA